jgi:DNA-binding protein H-NS
MDMPLTPFEQALREVEDAKRRAEELRKMEYQQVVSEIRAKIALYGIAAEDLGFSAPVAVKEGKLKSGDKKDLRSEVRPKYRGPAGEEWSGRGIKPKWVLTHISNGHALTDLLIEKEMKS